MQDLIKELQKNPASQTVAKKKVVAKKPVKVERKKLKPKVATKPAVEQAHTATPAVRGFTSIRGYNFGNFEVFRAFTLAALIHSRYITVTAKGNASKSRVHSPDKNLLKAIMGATAGPRWLANWIDKKTGQMSAEGINKCNRSLHGEEGNYNTSIETLNAVLRLVKEGGKATIKPMLKGQLKEVKVDFTKAI